MNNLCIKKFTLFLFLLFSGNLILAQNWIQQGESIGSTTNPMQTIALNGNGEIMAYSLSYPKNTSTSETLGLVKVIRFDGTTWNQIGAEINYGGIYKSTYEDTAELALSLSDDGTILAIGAPMTNGWKGKVAVFKFDGTNWNQTGQELIPTAYANPSFGGALKITPDGSTIIVGASNTITSASFYGMVEVYHLDSETSQWTQVGQSLINNSSANGGGFGYDVDINDAGNIIAVSQTNGSAKIYQLDGTIWLQVASFPESPYTFVSLNAAGNRVALGSMTATNTTTNVAYAGLTRVYNNDAGTWNQVGQTLFGTSMFQMYARVRLNAAGDILAVGSEGISSLIPKAQVYKILDNNWTQIGQSIEDIKGTFFGHDVDMDRSGQIVAIGSREGTGTANPHLAKIYQFQCDVAVPVAEANQQYVAGQTLADLSVSFTGTLKWFADQGLTTELPDTTVLETGKTYYVLQIVSICSSEATSITVEEKLAVNDTISNISKYYPNPVVDQFTIDSKDTIENVEVYSLTGKLILSQKINSKTANLSLRTLTSGNYLVKVTGSGKTDVMKIIKK
jgi:hypothetical protein